MFDLIELQHKLQEARNEIHPSKFVQRTAKVDDAAVLLRSGYFTPEEVAHFQDLPLSVVKAEQARIAERDQARRKYLTTLYLIMVVS
jgi:hypothetical protein